MSYQMTFSHRIRQSNRVYQRPDTIRTAQDLDTIVFYTTALPSYSAIFKPGIIIVLAPGATTEELKRFEQTANMVLPLGMTLGISPTDSYQMTRVVEIPEGTPAIDNRVVPPEG